MNVAAPGSVTVGTLRAQLDERRAKAKVHSLKEAVGILVPLAVDLAQRHAAGERFFVTPSSLARDASFGFKLSPELARRPPTAPQDRACLAPEVQAGRPGDARASVFAVGAILYELLTAQSVGPGMRKPSDIVPGLPANLDAILGTALVADAAARPDDLKALATAIHHLGGTKGRSLPPPPVPAPIMDRQSSYDLDVSLSMTPSIPQVEEDDEPASPYAVGVQASARRPTGMDQATDELTQLKQRLESDPRPRYVVVLEGMDHGPFNAVELLQQIASHTFAEKDVLRDTTSGDERMISEWEDFAPFAEHARRHRDIAAEKVAIQKTVEIEKKSTRGKAVFGLTAIGVLIFAAGAWFLAKAGTRKDKVDVQADTATNVEAEGNLNVPTKKGGKGHRVIGEQNGVPMLAGGMSCEAAQAAYVEEINIGGAKVPADITSSQYGAILNGGSYLNGCGLPSSTAVDVCVAVQNGRAVGVSIRTRPSSPGAASCIASHVRGISFPAHPKLDVTRTSFAAQ